MKISFIVTYYNQENYVEESLNSILAIDKSCDWEIIVGDDGSTDGTVDKVKAYIEKYPKNIFLNVMPRDKEKRYAPVKRASENRLRALELSTGDMFCILDGDDFYIDTDFINDAVKVFDDHKDVSVVAFGYQYYTNGEFGKSNVLPLNKNQWVDKRKYLESCYVPAGACVHRLCWDRNRLEFIKSIGYFDDNDIVINSLNYGEMYAFDRAIYAYRQTGTSVYNSMNIVEQALLNTQGFDVDMRLIDQSYWDTLVKRNASNILIVYIWRRSIQDILGEGKFKLYSEECARIEDSFSNLILTYSDLTKEQRIKMKQVLRLAIRGHHKCYLKLKIKYYLREIPPS